MTMEEMVVWSWIVRGDAKTITTYGSHEYGICSPYSSGLGDNCWEINPVCCRQSWLARDPAGKWTVWTWNDVSRGYQREHKCIGGPFDSFDAAAAHFHLLHSLGEAP